MKYLMVVILCIGILLPVTVSAKDYYLWTIDLDGQNPQMIPLEGLVGYPFAMSKDDRIIGYGEEGTKLFELNGSVLAKYENIAMTDPQWTPDGKTVVFYNLNDNFIHKLDVISSQITNLNLHGVAKLSPDGSTILYVEYDEESRILKSASPWIMSIDGTNKRQLSHELYSRPIDSASWHPNGEQLAIVAKTTYERSDRTQYKGEKIVAVDVQTEESIIITEGVGLIKKYPTFNINPNNPVWSPLGNFICYKGLSYDQRNEEVMQGLYLYDVNSKKNQLIYKIKIDDDYIGDITWTEDERMVLFRHEGIWKLDIPSRTATRITRMPAYQLVGITSTKKMVFMSGVHSSQTAALVATGEYKGTKWGMSPEEVKTAIPDVEWQGRVILFYLDTLAQKDAAVIFIFTQDKLARVAIVFAEKYINRNNYILDYQELKEILSQKYGKPIEDKTYWKNNLYKDDPDDYGIAIAAGHLTLYAFWETSETKIDLECSGEKSKIGIKILYTSKRLKHLIDAAKKSEIQEDF